MIILLAATLLFPSAIRHDASVSSSKIEVSPDGITLTFTLSLEDFSSVVDLSGGKEGLLRREFFEARLPRLFRYLSERLTLRADGATLAPRLVRGVFPGERPLSRSDLRALVGVVLRYDTASPAKEISLRCDAFRERVTDAKHLVDFSDGRSDVLDANRPEATWSAGGDRPPSLGRFVVLGVEHILTGWDHLVFLASLLLATAFLRHVLQFVTAFTVAHSITLGLTALRILRVPGDVVEPLIAASIVYVAVENLFPRRPARRWLLTFAFGLVHGMGFGGALVELNLSNPARALLGFNLGVELGQLGVVAVLFPGLALLRRREPFYRSFVVRGGSLAAAALGGFWFFARLF